MCANENDYIICIYTRLSNEDKDLSYNEYKVESGSITSQRTLILDYIKSKKEFNNCKIIEKCDDGFSGTKFDNRPQFTEMIELVKKGEINCIIVKDFSRFGRDYVELGNYLEQLFPFLGTRFISVNDNYDSAALADGTTGGLDMAFKNLIYDFYSRELSKKQRIAWRRMAEQGLYNASNALYGYSKSKNDIHKLVIEPEQAEIVKEIFSMKISGMSTTQIAKALNDRNVPTATTLYHSQGSKRKWRNGDNKTYWTCFGVECIIRNEKYTGTMVQLKRKTLSIRGKSVKLPEDEWIKVENTHEAIVDYATYMAAVSTLKRQAPKTRRNLRNIYYCGNCRRALSNKHQGTLFCKHKFYMTETECGNVKMNKIEADNIVLSAIKKIVEMFLERNKLSKQAVKNNTGLSTDDKINLTIRSIESAQKSWLALYDKYAGGGLDREYFLNEKRLYDENIKKMESELVELRNLQKQENSFTDSKQKTERALSILAINELTEEIKDKFIDKVYIFPDNKIEIIWKFDRYADDLLEVI